MKVLIADESPEVRGRLIRMMNGIAEAEIIGAVAHADEVCAILKRVLPDIAILDNRLPGADCSDLARRIKNRRPSAVVIELVDHVQIVAKKESAAAGADYLFDKKFELDGVVAMCGQISARFKNPVPVENSWGHSAAPFENLAPAGVRMISMLKERRLWFGAPVMHG